VGCLPADGRRTFTLELDEVTFHEKRKRNLEYSV
jgi:hypothetical protein